MSYRQGGIDVYAKTVLGNRVQLVNTGKEQGNFSPNQWIEPGKSIVMLGKQLGPIRGLLGASYFFVSRLAFSSRWLTVTSEHVCLHRDDPPQQWGDPALSRFLLRSREPADGVILPPGHDPFNLTRDSALGGFNADCPFGVIIWPDGRLGFCHLGLECVLPKDGRPGILDTAPLEEGCVVHITAGIGPCCYGRDDGWFDYVFERFPEAQGGIANRGPRAGQPSLNLHQLIRSVLAKHDITAVSEDGLCTACAATPDDRRLYYSNVADRGTPDEGGRNCVAVRRITL